ncbi:ABC transporter substrate-binding protein [Brevibacterium sediminis]
MKIASNAVRTSTLTRRSLLGGVAGLGSALLLSACSSGGSPTTASSASAGKGGAPSRIVATSTGHLDHCLALGVMPVGMTVAVAAATNSSGIPDFLKDEFGKEFDLDAIEVVGERMNPDLEKIAELEPDLILSNKRAETKLEQELTGIAKVVKTNGGSENFKDDLGIVAGALGQEAKGRTLLEDYEKRAGDWGEKRGTKDSVSLVRSKGDQYLYFGRHSLASIVAEDSGMIRPKSQRFDDKPSHELSLEKVEMLDADWLFHAFPGGKASPIESELWKGLDVVEAGHAFPVDVDPWFLNASVVAANRVLDDMQKCMA